MSNVLKTVVSYNLSFLFLVVSCKRVNLVPVPPSWLKEEVWNGRNLILLNLEDFTERKKKTP